MENYSIFIFTFAIGLVYFGIVTFFVRKFHFKYVYGLILPLAIVLFFFVLSVINGQTSTNIYEGLGYLILMVLGFCILIGYISGWITISLIDRKKHQK